jgi:hypothetical protein
MKYPAQGRTSQRLTTDLLRYTQHLKTIIVLAVICEVILNCFNVITAFDFSWQLTEGQFILSHGYPAHSILHAYGDISPHFVNEYILYEVLIATIHNIFGPIGLIALFGLISMLIYGPCLFVFYKSRNRFPIAILLLFFICQFVLNLRMAARPELLAYPCFIALGTILLSHRSASWSGRETAGTGFLFFIWANAHSSFFIGLGMLGLWFCQIMLLHWRSLIQTRDRTFIQPMLAALLGSALNPFGLFRFVQPFELHGLLWGQATSREMWPLPPRLEWLPLICTFVAIMILLICKNKEAPYWLIITVLGLQYLTFKSNRYGVFIALSLLIAIGYWLTSTPQHSPQAASTIILSAYKLCIHCFLAVATCFLIGFILAAKKSAIETQSRYLDPNTLLGTNASFFWLKERSTEHYFLLSSLGVNSWAQLPDVQNIYPLLDSGTHRFSDGVNRLYYYSLFHPETFKLVLSMLHVNAIIVGSSNIYWAPILNRYRDWRLAQIDSDSQLYLRRSQDDMATNVELFSQWESASGRGSSNVKDSSAEDIIRGIGIRPDKDSLQMLQETHDASWMFDPQITYIRDWLNQLRDDLVEDALKTIDDKSENSATGLKILFRLRLKQYQQAAEIARTWNPSLLDAGFQDMQELRAEAFDFAGDQKAARRTIECLRPEPRYSLRWAELCQLIYSDDPKAMPENARLLVDLTQDSAWEDKVIAGLNQNIIRLSFQSP